MDYKNILVDYIHKNNCKLVEGDNTVPIFNNYKEKISTICGGNIFETLEDYFIDDEPNIIKYIIINDKNEPISIFAGSINDDTLDSEYTCSTSIKRGGLLLRFYALLSANEINPNVIFLKGGISGGIPSIIEGDTVDIITKKLERLKQYHIDNGAKIEGYNFTYNIDSVKQKINILFNSNTKGGRKTKTKKNRKYLKKSKKSIRKLGKRKKTKFYTKYF